MSQQIIAFTVVCALLLAVALTLLGTPAPVAALGSVIGVIGTYCAPPLRLATDTAQTTKQWQLVVMGVTAVVIAALNGQNGGVGVMFGISAALAVGAARRPS